MGLLTPTKVVREEDGTEIDENNVLRTMAKTSTDILKVLILEVGQTWCREGSMDTMVSCK